MIKQNLDNLMFNLKKEIITNKYRNIQLPINFKFNQRSLIKNKTDIFLFDVKLPKNIELKTKDVKIKLDTKLNYEFLKINIGRLLEYNDTGNIYLFSNYEQDFTTDTRLINITYNIDYNNLMFERVLCMYNFVNSKFFKNNTCFVDSDAFVKIDKLNLFDNEFDVALTHRDISGFMPINEGVFFVKVQNIENVKNFFKEYLSNFLTISESDLIKKYYNMNIKQWRGGQLSLNMIVYRNGSKFLDYESIEDTKFKLLILPVYYYNFSPEVGKQYSLNFIKQKKVLHFKGNRKKYFSLRNL